jgi:hypothetical protein
MTTDSGTRTRLGKRLSVVTAAQRGFYRLDDPQVQQELSAGVLARWATAERPPTSADMAQWRARPEWPKVAGKGER